MASGWNKEAEEARMILFLGIKRQGKGRWCEASCPRHLVLDLQGSGGSAWSEAFQACGNSACSLVLLPQARDLPDPCLLLLLEWRGARSDSGAEVSCSSKAQRWALLATIVSLFLSKSGALILFELIQGAVYSHEVKWQHRKQACCEQGGGWIRGLD